MPAGECIFRDACARALVRHIFGPRCFGIRERLKRRKNERTIAVYLFSSFSDVATLQEKSLNRILIVVVIK